MLARGTMVALALALACAPLQAAERDSRIGVSLGAGYDTNALRITDDGPDGAFTEARLDGRLVLPLGGSAGWFVDGYGRTRIYESANENADYGSGELRTGFSFSPAEGRLHLAVGGLYAASRSTYTDRSTGNIYELPVNGSETGTLPIARLFDADTSGAFLDARWRINDTVRLFLETRLENADYVSDYPDEAGLFPLDYRAVSYEPGVLLRLSDFVAVEIAALWTDLEYDEQPAVNGEGFQVQGTRRTYDYTQYRMTLRIVPTPRWRLRVGARGGGREDTFAGYYSFGTTSAFVSVDHKPARRLRLQLYASTRELDYDAATVSRDPEGSLRGNSVQRVIGRADWKLKRHLGLFAELGAQRTDSQDPIYAYDRDWVLSGIQFRR